MKFQINNNALLYKYTPYGDEDWLINRLNDEAEQRVSKIFYFEKKHLVDYTDGTYTFQLGIIDGEYFKIDKDILYRILSRKIQD